MSAIERSRDSALRGREKGGPAVGYLAFAMGTLLGIWLTWVNWKPQSDENPFLVLLLVWVIAGIAHMLVRSFWGACVISAIGSGIGYVVLAVAFLPNPFDNDMFGAGMIEVGLFGFVLSMVMGFPVARYRRARDARTSAEGEDGGSLS